MPADPTITRSSGISCVSCKPGCSSRCPVASTRGVCDTAPLLERDFARRAGLGWFGKNTMLIDKYQGSYFLLGALLTDIELPPTNPSPPDTAAPAPPAWTPVPPKPFPSPGVLDARRCISYLTIELRGPVPEELRPGIGDWLFGCDICRRCARGIAIRRRATRLWRHGPI